MFWQLKLPTSGGVLQYTANYIQPITSTDMNQIKIVLPVFMTY